MIGDGHWPAGGLLFAANSFNNPNVRNNILEGEMPKASSNLGTMSVDALLELRDKIGAVLSQRGTELRQQLQRLDVVGGGQQVKQPAKDARATAANFAQIS